MQFVPTALSRPSATVLRIEWNDGLTADIPVSKLRDQCPCATCNERRNAAGKPKSLFPILDPAETLPASIASMKPVGHYAYSIHFSDGHDTGIFTLEMLRELSAKT